MEKYFLLLSSPDSFQRNISHCDTERARKIISMLNFLIIKLIKLHFKDITKFRGSALSQTPRGGEGKRDTKKKTHVSTELFLFTVAIYNATLSLMKLVDN